MYDCTEQLPCFDAESAVGAGPVPLDPLELPLVLVPDPLPELLVEVLLVELPLAPLPELEDVMPPDVELATPELVLSMPELDPLDPLAPFDPDAPLPPLDPELFPPEPLDCPAAHAPLTMQAPSIHVAVQRRMIMVVSLSPYQSLTNSPDIEARVASSQAP